MSIVDDLISYERHTGGSIVYHGSAETGLPIINTYESQGKGFGKPILCAGLNFIISSFFIHNRGKDDTATMGFDGCKIYLNRSEA